MRVVGSNCWFVDCCAGPVDGQCVGLCCMVGHVGLSVVVGQGVIAVADCQMPTIKSNQSFTKQGIVYNIGKL